MGSRCAKGGGSICKSKTNFLVDGDKPVWNEVITRACAAFQIRRLRPLVGKVTSLKLRTYFLPALSVVLLNGCIFDWHTYTRSRPDQKDLVGTWLPDAKTIDDMRTKGGYDVLNGKTRILLREDGTFEAFDMPDWWHDGFGKSARGLEHRVGTWQLVPHANER